MQHLHFAIAVAMFIGCESSERPTPPPTDPPTAPTPVNSTVNSTVDSTVDSTADSTVDSAGTKNRISLIAWNVESDGNDPDTIAAQLKGFADVDIFCLSEVHPQSLETYRNAVPARFSSANTKTGGGDRLQILFDAERFELLEEQELHTYRDHELNNGNYRSPLYVRLKDSHSGVEMIVMTNHLARGKAEIRNRQAIGLREWARDQSVAVINAGDFNLDYHYQRQKGNAAFDEMIRDNVWHWVKPVEPIDSNWADRDEDGKDDYPGSVLDFAFVAGPAKKWKPISKVIVRAGDFPDDEKTSDHRPIELLLQP